MINNFNKNKAYNFYKLFLFLIFSTLFLPQTFILNEDTNLIIAYEVDPGSIIASIINLFNFPYYSMFNGYHTTYYGWTFASLTFFFLLPFKLIFFIFKVESIFFTIFFIRLAFYIIGLFSVFILFRLCRKILDTKNLIISFFIVILFIFSPFTNLFYFLHPETTGILFTFLGTIYLIDYENKSQKKFFYYSIICFVLAILSKQQFLISSLFLTIFLLYLFCNKNKINFYSQFLFKEIIKIFLLSLFVLVLVHPYALLMPFKFLFSQGELAFSFSNTKNNLNFLDVLILWINLYISNSQFLILMVLHLLNIIFIFTKKYYIFDKIFNLIILLIIFLNFFYFALGNKTVIIFHYFQAIYPVIILQFLFCLKNFLDYEFFKRPRFKFLLIILLSFFSFNNFIPTFKSLEERFSYKEKLAYKSFVYVKENLSINDKIAHDHHVAIPSSMENISCHYWRSCNNYDKIVNFNPKYVAFVDPLPVWSWSDNLEGKALKKYAEDKKMKLVKTINDKNSNIKILFFSD